MKIEFRRTGGLSPLTNSGGIVNFLDNAASVVANDGKYQRELASDEIQQLRAAADPARLASPGSSQPANSQLRDGFQYSITITTGDGKRHSMTINTAGSSGELEKLSPSATQLLGWVEQESRSILTNKATK